MNRVETGLRPQGVALRFGIEPLRGKAGPGWSLRRRRCIPKRRATPWGRSPAFRFEISKIENGDRSPHVNNSGVLLVLLTLLLGSVAQAQQPAPLPPASMEGAAARETPSPAQEDSGFDVSDTNVGYIDNALPASQVIVRYDAGFTFAFPNRSEFFYARGGPGSQGSPFLERRIDYQHLSAYVETAWLPDLSTFVEVPIRWINPDINANEAGLSDINAGCKWAFYSTERGVASFQFRTYAPSGDSRKGLGTNHTSIEPALLLFAPINERLSLVGELRYWFPIGGSDFAGDLFRYGAGFRYDLIHTCSLRLAPVVELVGWTVLSGQQSRRLASGGVLQENARGTDILNAKLGVRLDLGDRTGLYAGYGRALTGETWYKDVARVELRWSY
jgi:hypothetical protein